MAFGRVLYGSEVSAAAVPINSIPMNANTAIWKAAKKLSPSAGKIPNGP